MTAIGTTVTGLGPLAADSTRRIDEAGRGACHPLVARDIPFTSVCQHHLLPFSGVAHVGYVPDRKILGLSKLARVVEQYARDLQVQERLTTQVVSWLSGHLAAPGAGVAMVAEHQCMLLRGVKATGSTTAQQRCSASCATTLPPASSSFASPACDRGTGAVDT